ncbi:MAG: GNAT family N-acetyltransferase [Candidatus Hermodarchaeota archaeon]
MKFAVGYDYKKNGFSMNEFREEIISEFGYSEETEEEIVNDNLSHLIAMIEDKQVIGWAIWHESNTREHQKGNPRGEEDIKILEQLTNGYCEVIELHELWLKKAYRGSGYGKQFFKFFEEFILTIGYDKIVYYADNVSAINICRKHGYKEFFNQKLKWHTFYKKLNVNDSYLKL